MPKNIKKKNKNIDEVTDLTSEVSYGAVDEESIISGISDTSDKSNAIEVDKDALLLQSVCECCDKLSDSNTTHRLISLKYLYKSFQRTSLNLDDSWNYCDTILDGLERIVRKGKSEEQYIAIQVLTTFLIQVGAPFIDKYTLKLREIFEPIYRDVSYAYCVRQVALYATCITYFLGSDVNWNELRTSMEYMEAVFRGSYLKGDGSHPNITLELFQLHIAALDCWGVLFSLIPSSMIMDLVNPLLSKFHQILQSLNVDLRISAGSLLALIYERIRQEINPRFRGNDYPFFVAELESLAKDGSKFRAKNERKKQRQSFRDILTAVQSETVDFPLCKVQFGNESLELQSWSKKCHYDILCDVLETGINKHLQLNIFIREIFDLGLPVIFDKFDLKQSKMSHKERSLINQASSKVRKQARQINRTKRSNVNDIHLSD